MLPLNPKLISLLSLPTPSTRLNYKSLPKPLKQATQKRVLNFIDCVNRLCEIEATTSSISLPEAKKKLLVERSQKLETIILQTNMRLVYSIALQHQGMGVNIDDLVDEGVLGLRHALSKYDITRGYAFSTYAYPWIKDYMRSALSKALPISLPRHVYKLLVKVHTLYTIHYTHYTLYTVHYTLYTMHYTHHTHYTLYIL
jgi:DNA-directed RNA polymerase sigma subunit (sigma70/sigma32)